MWESSPIAVITAITMLSRICADAVAINSSQHFCTNRSIACGRRSPFRPFAELPHCVQCLPGDHSAIICVRKRDRPCGVHKTPFFGRISNQKSSDRKLSQRVRKLRRPGALSDFLPSFRIERWLVCVIIFGCPSRSVKVSRMWAKKKMTSHYGHLNEPTRIWKPADLNLPRTLV